MYEASTAELTEAVYRISPEFRRLVDENTPAEDRPDYDPGYIPADGPVTEAQAAALLYNTNPEFRAFVDSRNVPEMAEAVGVEHRISPSGVSSPFTPQP